MVNGLKNYDNAIRELALRREKAAEDAADGPAPLEYLSFQDYASRQALFADESVTGVKCPVCGAPLAMQRWVNQGDRRYMNLAECPEHGKFLVRVKLHRTEEETWTANRMLYEMTASDEWLVNDMVDCLADKYLKPCTCPIFTRNDDRLRRLGMLIDRFQADGVVHQVFAGCLVYEMEQKSVADMLNARGVPLLAVETDYSPDDMGQMSTRVEAFLEAIKNRKRARKTA
jgi:ssDNA-binding Zn-finger/Zn-ribbon topoisomerase 1